MATEKPRPERPCETEEFIVSSDPEAHFQCGGRRLKEPWSRTHRPADIKRAVIENFNQIGRIALKINRLIICRTWDGVSTGDIRCISEDDSFVFAVFKIDRVDSASKLGIFHLPNASVFYDEWNND